MDYKKFLKIEIFFKILSKGIGVGKSFLFLLIFGFSTQLDSHYFALSLTGIILSIPIVYELLYIGDLKKNIESKNIDFIQTSFLQLITISVISSLVVFIFISIFNSKDVLYHIIILFLWANFFIINSFNILLLRLENEYKTIGVYFLLFPLSVSLFIIVGHYLFQFNTSLLVSISILFAEISLVLFLKNKIAYKYFNISKLFILSLYSKTRALQILKSFSLILVVYLIDVTDKSFSYKLDEGYTTVLIYGSLFPLMIRQALDFKSVFYHKLQDSLSIKNDLQIFYQTLRWFGYIIIPLIAILYLGSNFIKIEFLNKFIEIRENQFSDLMSVFFVYIFILPIYIIWDMMYRIYYKNDFLNKLFVIMFIGVFLNYGLNYFFVKILYLKTTGIALSTLIVLSSYCLYSFLLLKIEEKKLIN